MDNPAAPKPSELRDHLANERTFLAWIRTAITMVALGFVVARFGLLLREVGGVHVHTAEMRAGPVVGIILIFSALIIILLALRRFLIIGRDIEHSVVAFSPALDIAVAAVISLVGTVLAVYLMVTS